MKERENKITHKEEKDIHERDIYYLEKSYKNAIELAKKYNWQIVDCIKEDKIKTREEIHKEVYQILREK